MTQKGTGALACLLVAAMIVMAMCGCGRGKVESSLEDLRSANVVVREQAIVQLGDLDGRSATGALTEFLDSSQPKGTRLLATRALGKIGQDEAVPILIRAIPEDDLELRTATVEALGMIGDVRAVQPLIEQAKQTNVQLTAIWALGNLRCQESIAALTELLKSDDKFVRYNARQSLKRLGRLE